MSGLLWWGVPQKRSTPGAVLLDTDFDRGAVITATNSTGFDQHDAVFTTPAPIGMDTSGFRLRELTARETSGTTVAGFDNPQSWRYGSANTSSPNQWLGILPAYASGSTVYGKAPGKWAAGETRYFLLSWNAAGGGSAYEYNHLGGVGAWTATVTRGSTGDVYALTVGGITCSYTQLAGDSTATLVAVGLVNAINTAAYSVAYATNTAGVVTVAMTNSSTSFSVLLGGTTTTAGNLVVIATGTPWTVTCTAGTGGDGVTTGDIYALSVGGTTYSYRMVTGDTATVIAAALKALINAGAVAKATNVAGVLTVGQTNAQSVTFQVITGGTTTTAANLVVSTTGQPRFKIGRTGPDTSTFPVTTYNFGLPLGLGGTILASRCGFGRADTRAFRMGDYRESGGASAGVTYGPNAAGQYTQPLTQTRNGPTTDYTGRLVFTQRAGGDDWVGTYTAKHKNVLYLGRKSDDTGTDSLLKHTDVLEFTIVWTAQRAYTPQSVLSNVTAANSVLKIFDLDTTNATFTSNVTEAAGNKLAGFYFRPGTDSVPQEFLTSADLSALSVTGTVVGMHGNTLGMGLILTSVTTAGMGSQAPEAKWAAGGTRPTPQLQFRNLSNGTTIPQGATITVTGIYCDGSTNNATSNGDNLLPDEVVSLLRSLAAGPIVGTTGKNGRVRSSSLTKAMGVAGAGAVQGLQYFVDNAVAVTTVARGYSWNKQIRTGAVSNPDDDDGSYGVAYGLLGLVLRYRRLHDATTITLLENYVQYFIDIEAAAVAKYGAFWSGALPYWYYWTTGNTTYTQEGGIQEASGATGVDPGVVTFSAASVTITNAGTGYTSTPTVTFSAPAAGGVLATGTVVRSGNTVGSITITNPGNGYNSTPTVSFSGGGGANAAGTVVTQPGLGTITYGTGIYTQGSPRRKTSIDQMQTCAFALWSYMALLANEPAITANTTLRANALSLLSRMSTFEATYYNANAQIITNIYRICAGLDAKNPNGIDDANLNTAIPTTINNPFWGNVFNAWNVLNGTGAQNTASSNTTLLAFFRGLFSPDSVESGVVRWITGQSNDMIATDLSRHDVVLGATMAGQGASGLYPPGWSARPAVPSNTTVYETPRVTAGNTATFGSDLHYLSINGGARDHMSGRSAQRSVVLALALMLSHSYAVATENNGSSILRSVAISTALDDTVRAILRYGIEPTTKANRVAASGWLSKSTTYDPQIVESPYTGYWMAAVEMWFLAQDVVAGTRKLKDYFRFEGDSLAEWERTTPVGPYIDSNQMTDTTIATAATAAVADHANTLFLSNHSILLHEHTSAFYTQIRGVSSTLKLIAQESGKWALPDPPNSWANGWMGQTLADAAAANADSYTANARSFWSDKTHHLGYNTVDDANTTTSAGSENGRQTIQKSAYLITSLRANDPQKFATPTIATVAGLPLVSGYGGGLGMTDRYGMGAKQSGGGYGTTGPFVWTSKGDFKSSHSSISSSHDLLDEWQAWRATWPKTERLIMALQAHCTNADVAGAQVATPTSQNDLRYPFAEEIPLMAWMAVACGVSGLLWFTYNDELNGSSSSDWLGYGNASQSSLRTAIAAINNRVTTEPIASIIRRLQWDAADQPFTLTGGGEATNNYSAGFVSALKDPWTQTYYLVVGNYGLTGKNVQVLSGSLTGTLKGMESGSTYALGANIALSALDGTILRFIPS